MSDPAIKFLSGILWERCRDAEIHLEYLNTYQESDEEACPHAHSFQDEEHERSDKTKYRKRQWVVPRVVLVYNEGGHNTTGICVDCLIDTLKQLPERRNEG